MESIWNKFSYDRAAAIEVALSIITNRGQLEWLRPEREAMDEAVDYIVLSLGGGAGLTFVEFEILVAFAARVDPRAQLDFLDNIVGIIRASRIIEPFSEYDQRFLDFVAGIHNGLTVARGANLGLYPPGLPDANIAQDVYGQGPVPVDLIQATTSGSTRTWKSEFEEVSEAGKYNLSVVETVTGDVSMPGGAYSTMSTTSSSFTPSSVPTIGYHEGSMDIMQSIEGFEEMTLEPGVGEGRSSSFLEGLSGLRLDSGVPSNLNVHEWN